MSPPAGDSRRLSWLLAAGTFTACLVAGGAWWFFPAAQPDAARPVVVLVTGDTSGWIVPCGCTSNQSGGLLRRGSYVAELRAKSDVTLVDVGGAPGGTSPYDRAKFEAILRGELLMGLAAHNIGGPEAALGTEYLRRVAGELGVPFLSANIRDAGGVLVTTPTLTIERGGRRLVIIGVLSRRYAASGLQIDDPREAILREVARAKGQYDSLIVLAYLPEDELQRLAAALPEADAVIGGPTGQCIAPRQLGPTMLASATNKGKFVVRLDARGADRRAWNGQVVELDGVIPDDTEQQANVKAYLNELSRRDFTPAESGLGPKLPASVPGDYRLAGIAACNSCHKSDCSAWEGSKHARAWTTLSARGYHIDPYCQQCHTTGYGMPGGFASALRSEAARSVGCESCHGPSAGHVREPKMRTPFAARDQCVTCHDRENSPLFNYGEYWPRIRHGATKVTPP